MVHNTEILLTVLLQSADSVYFSSNFPLSLQQKQDIPTLEEICNLFDTLAVT